MGTNYYLHPKDPKPPCETCGRDFESEVLHIGKSSAGWHFALHGIPELGLMDLAPWELRLGQSGEIRDEYGQALSVEEMLAVIRDRGREKPPGWDTHEFTSNHAEPGLNNLIRSRIEAGHCVAHGEGPWDIIVGEFS